MKATLRMSEAQAESLLAAFDEGRLDEIGVLDVRVVEQGQHSQAPAEQPSASPPKPVDKRWRFFLAALAAAVLVVAGTASSLIVVDGSNARRAAQREAEAIRTERDNLKSRAEELERQLAAQKDEAQKTLDAARKEITSLEEAIRDLRVGPESMPAAMNGKSDNREQLRKALRELEKIDDPIELKARIKKMLDDASTTIRKG